MKRAVLFLLLNAPLLHGAQINTTRLRHRTTSSTEVTQLLQTETFDVQLQQAFFEAVEINNIETVRALLEGDIVPNMNALNADGHTALSIAITKSYFPLAKLLIQKGADPETHDKFGWTALLYSSLFYSWSGNREYLEIAKLLLTAGANPNYHDTHGVTPLMLAVKPKNSDLTQLLLSADANPHLQSNAGRNALMQAILWGDVTIIKMLINAQVDVNLQDNKGYTALMLAVREVQYDAVELLIASGANVDIKNEDNKTALDYVADLYFWQRAPMRAAIEIGTQMRQELRGEELFSPTRARTFSH